MHTEKKFIEIIETAPHIVKRKLEQLKFLRERPDFHPEPSAFHHIQIVTDRLIPTGNAELIMAGIFHDICKFDTVRENLKTGWPTSPGHDDAAFELIEENMQVRAFCTQHGANPDTVALICKNHMRFHQLDAMRPAKQEKQMQEWHEQGIFELLQIFGSADDMLKEFNLETFKSSIIHSVFLNK
jgi:hypothetical protein